MFPIYWATKLQWGTLNADKLLQNCQVHFVNDTTITFRDYSIHDNAVRDILGYNQSRKKYIGFEREAQPGEIFTEEFRFTLAEGWKLENTHVVVYVCVQSGTQYVVNNVIDVRPNETLAFEYSE